MLVASDELTKKGWDAIAKGKGDGFMIAGATLYGFSECLGVVFIFREAVVLVGDEY